MIAFQTVDRDRDIWAQKAIVFTDKEKCINFFNDWRKVLDLLGHELEPYENIDTINYEIHYISEGDIIPNAITYKCEYAGEVRICKMYEGYLI